MTLSPGAEGHWFDIVLLAIGVVCGIVVWELLDWAGVSRQIQILLLIGLCGAYVLLDHVQGELRYRQKSNRGSS